MFKVIFLLILIYRILNFFPEKRSFILIRFEILNPLAGLTLSLGLLRRMPLRAEEYLVMKISAAQTAAIIVVTTAIEDLDEVNLGFDGRVINAPDRPELPESQGSQSSPPQSTLASS